MAGSIPKIDDPFVLARFFQCVDFPTIKSGCWNWTGIENSNGYGRFSYKDSHRLAHRVSYMIFFGEIPQGFMVCHQCDNRKCVNPSHLWLGTQSDNLKDAVAKGRMVTPDTSGECNGNRKLNWQKVRQIRDLHDRGMLKSHLAQLFRVSPSTVSNIINNDIWKEAA